MPLPVLASDKTCTGCLACSNVCPAAAIVAAPRADGHTGISVDADRCIRCGRCERACPVVNGRPYGRQEAPGAALAAWANDDAVRRRGATAGIFGALASQFLREAGGFVAGAVMDGLRCRYILTSDLNDLPRLQGSKYTASDPGDIYRRVLSALKEGGRVLFCGLPCHVAGLLNVIPPRLQERLFTVDLICGGVSSPLLVDRFAEAHPDMTGIRSFRDKEEGWNPRGYRYRLQYIGADGSVIRMNPAVKNLVTDGFACELTDRHSCYRCRMAFPSRNSDLTIGDLWGDRRFTAQHRQGVSLVLVHSPKGEVLLTEAGIETAPVDPREALAGNSRIFNGDSAKRFFPERIFFPRLVRRLSFSALERVYAGRRDGASPLWLPFWAWRLISFRLAGMLRKATDRRLISRIFTERHTSSLNDTSEK